MDKLNAKLVNCYGIKKLEHIFDFSKHKNYLIYASNGMMKTSFTKTFKVLSLGKKPTDEIFGKKTVCEVKVDEDIINKEDIFVISSYEDEYISPNSAKLMVHKDLRKKYDAAIEDIAKTRAIFFSAIDVILGDSLSASDLLADFLKCNPIDIVSNLFELYGVKFLEEDSFNIDFNSIKYSDIFNDGVKKFVSDPKNLEQIKEYEKRYNELLEKSPIYKRGVFSHNNAESISQNLISNGFFGAEHKIYLHGIDKQIQSAEELSQIIKEEKKKIFADEKLQGRFEKINTALGKRTLGNFRTAIELNKEIIPQLIDFDAFKKKVWVYILKQVETELCAVIEEYQKCQNTIAEIKNQANNERTQWDNVLEVFKARFTAPFTIEVPNKDDVAFADKMPEFVFKYIDMETNEEMEVPRKDLEKVLSQGEKRALFLLNIINELEALKLANKPCLVIADDIAESFDYKNKYAIIEYLQEMMMDKNFHFIVLTHNFDFYRTVAKRSKDYVFPQMVQRKQNGIEITNPKYVFKNPFESMKKGMVENNKYDILTSIPFVRNLIEYTRGEGCDEYLKLTSLLHIKKDTKSITLKDLEDIFNKELKMDKSLDFSKNIETDSVFQLIKSSAKEISQNNRDEVDLSGKIIVSMAIRLLTEDYLIDELDLRDKQELLDIKSNQTGVLVNKYKTKFPEKTQTIMTLNKVLLISSENIHLNSFMFEPLIDMSNHSLFDLYGEVLMLIQ